MSNSKVYAVGNVDENGGRGLKASTSFSLEDHELLVDDLTEENLSGVTKGGREMYQEQMQKIDTSKSANSLKDKCKPIVCEVTYKINRIADIDSISSDYYIDLKVFYQWEDQKAIGFKGVINSLEESGFADPEIEVVNARALEVESSSVKVVDTKTGKIKQSLHYRGTCFIPYMSLREFPFDIQVLQFKLKPKKLSTEKFVLTTRGAHEGCVFDDHLIHEWEIEGHYPHGDVTDPKTSSTGKAYSEMNICVLLRRKDVWFINNVYTVMSMIFIFSISSFLMEPEERDPKIAIIMTCLLAGISNKFVVAPEMPKLEYRTMVEAWTDFIIFLILLNLYCCFFVKWLIKTYDYETADIGNACCVGALLCAWVSSILINVHTKYSIERKRDNWMKTAKDFHAGIHIDEHLGFHIYSDNSF